MKKPPKNIISIGEKMKTNNKSKVKTHFAMLEKMRM
jgi:hypothetical protein